MRFWSEVTRDGAEMYAARVLRAPVAPKPGHMTQSPCLKVVQPHISLNRTPVARGAKARLYNDRLCDSHTDLITMPIYAYKCNACGFAQDVLQKMSDPVLTVCPTCGQASYAKQLTAAGFQLKGSGWYATDFKGGGAASAAAATATAAPAAADAPASAAPATKVEAAPTTGSCGGGCACHS